MHVMPNRQAPVTEADCDRICKRFFEKHLPN